MILGEYGHDDMRLQATLTRELQIDEIMLLTDEAMAIRAAISDDHSSRRHRNRRKEDRSSTVCREEDHRCGHALLHGR